MFKAIDPEGVLKNIEKIKIINSDILENEAEHLGEKLGENPERGPSEKIFKKGERKLMHYFCLIPGKGSKEFLNLSGSIDKSKNQSLMTKMKFFQKQRRNT